MIPKKLKVRGVTVLKDVEVDFDKIPGDLIAVTGLNGQGKTSLIESVFASLYRTFPSRPAGIYASCHGKDAKIEFDFDWHGEQYRTLLNIDAVQKEMESFLYGFTFDGEPQPYKGITGKNKDFDKVIEKLFGDSAMVLASSFAAQTKQGNFLDLEKIERKRLFLGMLNLEKLGQISKLAGAGVFTTDNALEQMRFKEQQLDAVAKQVLPDLDAMRKKNEEFSASIFEQEARMDKLKEEVGVLKAKASMVEEIVKRLNELRKKLDYATKQTTDLATRKMLNQKLLEEAPKIKHASEQIIILRGEIEKQRKLLSQLTGQRREAASQKERYDTSVSEMRLNWLKEQGAMKAAEKLKVDAEQAAALMEEVPCKGEGDFAKCQFLLRAVEEKEKMEAYEVDILNHKQAMLRIQDDQKALIAPNKGLIANLDAQMQSIESTISTAEFQSKSLEPIAARGARVAYAEALVAELANQIKAIDESIIGTTASLTDAESEWATAKDSDSKREIAVMHLSNAQRDLVITKTQRENLFNNIHQAELLYKQADEAQQELAGLLVEIRNKETDRRQWALLETAFGPNGIQSLEIDAAGPTVSAYANELLFACYGARFSLKLITQKLLADGSGYKDEFDAVVMDTERGREGSVSELSGGEKVVVSEALGLAVAIFNKSKNGIAWESLWRDEVSGALDDIAAPKYIQMLRRAREIGHFLKVFFIAHQTRVQDLADSRINLNNGIAEIIS
jgi:exonuclease SbcC